MTNTYIPIRSDEIHIRGTNKTTHLHINASSSLKTLSNGDNYQSCAKLAAIALIGKGNIRLVNGEITSGKDTISTQHQQWKRSYNLKEHNFERNALAVYWNPKFTDVRGRRRNSRQNLRCSQCNRYGHERNKCWPLMKWLTIFFLFASVRNTLIFL